MTALFLFFIVLLCSSGFYLAFYISMHQIKKSQRAIIAKGGINDDHIFVFKFSAHELRNNPEIEMEESEFKYKGKMYDIISMENKNEVITISCISDGSEDYLLSLMGNSFYKLQKEKTSTHLIQLKWQLDNYTFNVFDYSAAYFKHLIKYRPQKCLCIVSNEHKNVPSPPPWLHLG
ncbi:MAG: hypothetical protein JSS98_04930 [Bacteroidetes bacterium]|nr:hypothetical protein [Bacteroidota bacterium]